MKRNITPLLLILFLLLSCLLVSCTENEGTKETTDGKSPDETTQKALTEEEKLGKLLDSIAKDYFDYHVENYKFDPELDGGFYVETYYGTYDGAVPVLMRGTKMAYAQVVTSETVAGYTFTYSDSNKMEVWKDGEFCSLSEAYDGGILTKEQIGEIREFKYLVFDSTEHYYPTPESEDAPLKADGETLSQIAKDYYDCCVEDKTFDPDGDGAFYIHYYYDPYNGAVPVIIKGTHIEEGSVVSETVAGCEFGYREGEVFKVWKDGEFYSLTEAYEKGILTKEKLTVMLYSIPVECKETQYAYPKN